jgi:hypothetical protein
LKKDEGGVLLSLLGVIHRLPGFSRLDLMSQFCSRKLDIDKSPETILPGLLQSIEFAFRGFLYGLSFSVDRIYLSIKRLQLSFLCFEELIEMGITNQPSVLAEFLQQTQVNLAR